MLPYTIDEISQRVMPVAKRYGLSAVYLFGSYARGEATSKSDIDLLIDTSGSAIDTLFKLGGLYSDLETALEASMLLPLILWKDQQIDAASSIFVRQWKKKR